MTCTGETRYDRKLATLSRTDKNSAPRRAGVAAQRYRVVLRVVQQIVPALGRGVCLSANNTAAEPEITQNKEIGVKLDLLGGKLSVTGALFNLERTNIKNTDPANPRARSTWARSAPTALS